MLFGNRGGIREVLLHVGHGKTGSSYIQSSLALSGEVLSQAGLCYPIEEGLRSRAASGLVTSGNLKPVTGEVARAVARMPVGCCSRVLLSSESLFRTLFDFALGEIREVCPKAHVRVLLFVRDPLSNAASSYVEFVKQGRTHLTFSEFLATFNKPQKVKEFIGRCRLEGLDIRVLNYSRLKAGILSELSDWAGLASGALKEPGRRFVNRSLTRSELFVQKELNRLIGDERAGFLSRELCNRLPDIASEYPVERAEVLEKFMTRMRVHTRAVNQMLGEDLYRPEDINPYIQQDGPQAVLFSEEQISAVIGALVRRLRI